MPSIATAYPVGKQAGQQSFALGNGLRTHYIRNDSGYVAATLVLRSKEITNNGLAHICEHTSCAGAAGTMSAAQVAGMYKAYIQEGNASTEAGPLSSGMRPSCRSIFPQVTGLLAAMALDQKFDLETVADASKRVVMEELYLDKYSPDKIAQGKFDRELFGPFHPYAKDTMAEEVARCKIPPAKLAAELRDFATAVRLPANMDLFLVGRHRARRRREVGAGAFRQICLCRASAAREDPHVGRRPSL